MIAHDISHDEMAKSHARYMVGGPSNVINERLFRFGKPCYVFSSMRIKENENPAFLADDRVPGTTWSAKKVPPGAPER